MFDLWRFLGGISSRIHLPMQETEEMQVWSLDQENSLECEMALHSNILGLEILWAEEAGRLKSMGPQTVRHDLSWFTILC